MPGDWPVITASHAFDKPEAHTLRFALPVPANGATRLLYRVRIRG